MRDSVILGGLNEVQRNVAKDITALHDLNILCRCRIDAVENVLFGSRFSLPWSIVLSIFRPSQLQKMIEDAHAESLADYNVRTVKSVIK